MGISYKPAVAAVAFAAAHQASAQFGPVVSNGNTGGGFFGGQVTATQETDSQATSNSDGGIGRPDEGGNSYVTETKTTTNIMGQPLTITNTYPVVLGSEVVKTTNLLGQSTTLYLPLRTSATATATGSDQGALTTYTTTDGYGYVHTITTHTTVPSSATSSPTSVRPNSAAPTSTGDVASTATPANAGASSSPDTTASPSASPQKSGMSSGAIAAAVVVPIIVVAIFIALGLFFFKRRKTRNARRAADARDVAGIEGGPAMQERHRGFASGGAHTTTSATGGAAEEPSNRRSGRPDSETTGGPPVISGTPGTAWHSSGSELSTSPDSTHSIRSDPFRDPSSGKSGSALAAGHDGQSALTSAEATPAGPTPADERGNPIDRPVSRRDGTLSPMSEGDEEAEIMQGEVAHVGTAQRASMVQMKASPPKQVHLHP